jgi:protein glucosyltransferase
VESCIPVAVPSNDLWDKYKNFSSRSWDEFFREQNRIYPWENKINKAIWRGAAIGNGHGGHNWREIPGVQVFPFSRINPDLLDAGLTSFSPWNETAQHEMQKSGFMNNFMQMEDFQKFKAIVDIDSYSWSSRFVSLLCMNSIVLKVVPYYVDYFFFELQPWVHYVPVHGNLSNLEEMIRWTTDKGKEKEMKTIVRNANNWCRQKMTGSQIVADMSWILNSYFEILQYEDDKSGSFTSWKDGYFRNNSAWNKKNWNKLL